VLFQKNGLIQRNLNLKVKDKKKLLIKLLKEDKITEEEFYALLEETEHSNKKRNKIEQYNDGFYEV
jgi:hypothetical protein